MANSQNTGSRADGRTGTVRSTAVPEQTWCGGEQRAVGRDGCAWSLRGGTDLAVSSLGNPCCVLLLSVVMV